MKTKKDDDTNIKCGTTGTVRVSNELFWTRYKSYYIELCHTGRLQPEKPRRHDIYILYHSCCVCPVGIDMALGKNKNREKKKKKKTKYFRVSHIPARAFYVVRTKECMDRQHL